MLDMLEACRTKRAPRTTAATAGSASKMNNTQEENKVPSGSEELWTVSQRMTGSAFATAAVSTSASGSNNFSPQIKVLVDTGNLGLYLIEKWRGGQGACTPLRGYT